MEVHLNGKLTKEDYAYGFVPDTEELIQRAR